MMRRAAILALICLAMTLTTAAGQGAGATRPDPLQEAQQEFAAGRYAEAARILQTALAQDATQAAIHFWLMRCFYEMRDVDNSIVAGERAVQLAPQVSEYHHWLGRAYGRKADRDRSLSYARKTKREFEEAVRLDPASIPARRDLLHYLAEAPAFLAGGSDSKAREQAEIIARQDPVQGRLAWADYWRENKKPANAEAEYRRVLEMKPKQADPYLEVADFYEWQRKGPELSQAVEAAARVQPGEPRLAYYQGVALVLRGEHPADAERHLKHYLASVPRRSDFPSHASAHYWLGALYEKLGKPRDAVDRYRTALQLNPKHKEAAERLRQLEG